MRLAEERIGATLSVLRATGARSVMDLGCGEGKFLRALIAEPAFERIVGRRRLASRARARGGPNAVSTRCPNVGALASRCCTAVVIYRDARLAGFDAAAVIEVIEHLDPSRTSAPSSASCSSSHVRAVVIVTTPNVGVQRATSPASPAGRFRHRDHRFEWTRAEFARWADGVAGRVTATTVQFLPVGPGRPATGAPTQMGSSAVAERVDDVIRSPSCRSSSSSVRRRLGQVDVRARTTSRPTEILSSDRAAALVSDDESRLDGHRRRLRRAALHRAQAARRGLLTVVDATNVQPEARASRSSRSPARTTALPVADRPRSYREQPVPGAQPRRDPTAISGRTSIAQSEPRSCARSMRSLRREGFRHVFVLTRRGGRRGHRQRQPLWNNRRDGHGPFDIIGDIHGCFDELVRCWRRSASRRVDGRRRRALDRRAHARGAQGRVPRRSRRPRTRDRPRCCAS